MVQRTLPEPGTPDPMQAPPVRWGIAAPGGIARMFASALRRGTRQQIVAVASRSRERAAGFAAEFGVPAVYGSYPELFADPQVDVVYIASPHSEHHAQARLALEAGKAVLVEKAFTRNAAEARDLVELATARGLFLLEAMWSRFLPHYDVLRRALADGLLGEVATVFADHGQWLLHPGGPERLARPELAGGALLDLGIYPVSLADMVLGPLTSLTATGTLTPAGVDAQETLVVTNAAGAQGVLHASMLARTPTTASICGTQGRLDVGGEFYCPSWVELRDRDGALLDRFTSGADVGHQGLRYEAAEVARCLTAGERESPLLPLDTTVRILQSLDAARDQLGVRFPGEPG